MKPEIAIIFGALIGGFLTLIGGGLAVLVQLYIAKTERADKLKLANTERLDKYKMVALEKRLEVHQTAFRYWYDLMWSLNNDTKRDVQAVECEKWWVDNQFYLDKISSDAFKNAASLANTFGVYKAGDKDAEAERKKAFRELHKVGNYLREGIGLPHLEDEKEWERKVFRGV